MFNGFWEDKIEKFLWRMTRKLMWVPVPRPLIVERNGVSNSNQDKANALTEKFLPIDSPSDPVHIMHLEELIGTPNDVYCNFEDIFEPKQNFQSFRASIQHNQSRNSSWTSHNGDRPKINHNSSSNYSTENFRKQNESNTTTVSPFCSENQNTKLLQIKDSLHVTKNSKPAKIISQPRVILGSIDQNKFYLTKDSSFPPNEKFKIVQENIITGQFVPSIKPQEIYESFDIENNYQNLCNEVLPIENMPQSIKKNIKLLDVAPVNKIQPSIIKNIQTNISNVCYNESIKQEKPGFFNNNESSNQESDEESNNIWDDIAWFDVLNTKLKNFQKQYSISDSLNSSDASFITNQADNDSCVKNKHDSCDEHIIDYNNDLSNDSISFSDICDQHSFFDGGKVCPESNNDVQMLNSQTSQFINTDKISNSNAQFDKVSEDDFSWLDEILFTGTPDKHIYTDSHKHKNEKSSPESKNLRNNILVTKISPSIEESSDILISQETKQIVCGKNKQEIKNNPKVKQKIFQTKTANDNTQVTVSFMNPFLPKLTRKRSNKKMNTINKPCDDNKDNKSEVTIGSANIKISAEKITKLDMSKPRMSLTCRKTRKLLKKASTFKSPLIQTTLHFNKYIVSPLCISGDVKSLQSGVSSVIQRYATGLIGHLSVFRCHIKGMIRH
uniref:Uncharacterized protein n=1 Tax=Timema douglasi TaxID=61478 RepID=A0A7R8VNR9_TIMDO|nr:unnamed protein product [Timema douglasi]